MILLFLLFLFLRLSFTGKEVTNFRGSCVMSKLSLKKFRGNLSRVNLKKPGVKDIVAIKSAINLIPGNRKRDGGQRSQLGRAEKKAKGKQH